MTTSYTRLSPEDRETISRGLAAGWKLKTIAAIIRRHPSTITHEVQKNCRYRRCYRAVQAQDRAEETRHRQKQQRKMDQYQPLRDYVLAQLRSKWSPEEIAKRLVVDYPVDATMRISHESIYTYIYCLPRGELRKELIKCLRQERNMRKRRKNAHAKRSSITNAISIQERPSGVADRTIPGHWEGDLIIGKDQQSALGTLVERTTRYLLLVPLVSRNAVAVRTAFAHAVKKLPRTLKRSLTYDRGTEMAEHELFTAETKIQVYFADPQSPWQRGTNENTNGLIRQYFPKGTDFRAITRKDVQQVQDQLNDRPRKVLKFLKPNEVFLQLLTHQKIALEG